jgi:DNA-binding response OmpR family regulator
VVKREELERAVWGDQLPDSDVLRAHMHVLRNAVEPNDAVSLIHTLRGIGYRMAAES